MKNVIVALVTVTTFVASVVIGLGLMGNFDQAIAVALMVTGVIGTIGIIAVNEVSESTHS